MKRKTIQVTLILNSGASDFDNCLAVENALLKSSLNNAEFALSVDEVKVVEKRDIVKLAAVTQPYTI